MENSLLLLDRWMTLIDFSKTTDVGSKQRRNGFNSFHFSLNKMLNVLVPIIIQPGYYRAYHDFSFIVTVRRILKYKLTETKTKRNKIFSVFSFILSWDSSSLKATLILTWRSLSIFVCLPYACQFKDDCLVKVWYNTSKWKAGVSGLFTPPEPKMTVKGELSFSFVYLAHPRSVTGFSWRKTSKYMPRYEHVQRFIPVSQATQLLIGNDKKGAFFCWQQKRHLLDITSFQHLLLDISLLLLFCNVRFS